MSIRFRLRVWIILWINWDTHVFWVIINHLNNQFFFCSKQIQFQFHWFSSLNCGVAMPSNFWMRQSRALLSAPSSAPMNYAISCVFALTLLALSVKYNSQQMLICFSIASVWAHAMQTHPNSLSHSRSHLSSMFISTTARCTAGTTAKLICRFFFFLPVYSAIPQLIITYSISLSLLCSIFSPS